MKTLLLVRHAKSSRKDPALPDFDRPLNHRGKKEAPEMGKRLAKRHLKPDAIISSPAVRALATAKALAEELDFKAKRITFDDSLYMAGKDRLLDVIYALDDAWPKVIIIAHNPGLTDLVNTLFPSPVDNIPTCGVAIVKFAIEEWSDVSRSRPVEAAFLYPKKGDD